MTWQIGIALYLGGIVFAYIAIGTRTPFLRPTEWFALSIVWPLTCGGAVYLHLLDWASNMGARRRSSDDLPGP
jgi:hypothetical protein